MIGTIVLIVVILAALVYFKKVDYVKLIAFEAVAQAEVFFKSGEGKAKLDFALKYINDFIPSWAKLFINEKLIIKIIEDSLSKLQGVFRSNTEKIKNAQINSIDTLADKILESDHLKKYKSNILNLKDSLKYEIKEKGQL